MFASSIFFMIEKFFLDEDIPVICLAATSFPQGVLKAHKELHTALPFPDSRKYYGISWGDNKGGIIYKAAASELHDGEAESLGYESFTIRKGEYISELLEDWCKEENRVEKTFKKLLADPQIDKHGYCLEMYLNDKDMRCLVKLESPIPEFRTLPLVTY
jgi:hypothetical protein